LALLLSDWLIGWLLVAVKTWETSSLDFSYGQMK